MFMREYGNYRHHTSIIDRFKESIGAEHVPLYKYAVLLSTLEDKGKLRVNWVAPRNNWRNGQVGHLLTATNPLARGMMIPSQQGAGSIDLLVQPDLIPLAKPETHNLGSNTMYYLGLSEDGTGLTADSQRSFGINSSVEIQELLNDRAEIARLREVVYREYHEAVEGDITAQLGMVAAQMANITALAERIGMQLPDTNMEGNGSG